MPVKIGMYNMETIILNDVTTVQGTVILLGIDLSYLAARGYWKEGNKYVLYDEERGEWEIV